MEAGVGHAKRTPLRGLRFETLAAAQAYLDRWATRWADTRIHGTTKRQVASMFAEEQPHLQPLPLEPFRYYAHGTRLVHVDGHVEVDRAYYSVPPGRIGTTVAVQWDGHVVRILDPRGGLLLREHRVDAPGRFRTREEDRPPRSAPALQQLLQRAERASGAIGVLCRHIADLDGALGSRRILGILALARRHGVDAVSEACAAELAAVPLLIIDDLAMRKLPITAAEDLLELIMRRHGRASTILTSNRPVEDWGKLLGDTPAVTAMLDRLLEHGHVITCGPKSWRLKSHAGLRREAPPQ